MGAAGKMIALRGCDYVTVATSPFAARRGYIYMFKASEAGTLISTFDEIPVTVLNNSWVFDPAAVAAAQVARSYTVAVEAGAEIWFDGPVTEITLTAGSGWVYYR